MLDKFGFRRKNYAEYLTETEIRARGLFGEDTNLSPLSPIGKFVQLVAFFSSKLAELAEKVYYAGQPTKAEGVQLDKLLPFYNTSRRMEQPAFTVLSFTGTPNYTIPEGSRFETRTGIVFVLSENVTLNGSGIGAGEGICSVTGPIGNVASGEISVFSEPNADISTVTNPSPASGGMNKETDAELIDRIITNGSAMGSTTVPSILAAVRNVGGVQSASLIENSTDQTVNGQPPGSIQVIALGGTAQEIGRAIFNKKAASVRAFGTNSVQIADDAGISHTIAYTPASVVNIYFTVTVTADNTFQADGLDEIRNNLLLSVIGGVANDGTIYKGLGMGDDVIFSKMLSAIMRINGVVDASLTMGKAINGKSAANIPIALNEAARTDISKIEVVVNT